MKAKTRISRKWWLYVDRWLSGNGWKQFLIPIVFIVVSMLVVTLLWWLFNGRIFALDGFVAKDDYAPTNVLDAAYFYLFGNGAQNLFPGSHFLGFLMTTVGLVMVAILTSSLTNFLDKRAEGYLSGDTAYRLKNHIVILGASDVAYSIISQYSKGKDYWFLIQTGKDIEMTRREFYGFLENGIKDERIVFIYGDRTSKDDLKRLSLSQAKEVFVIGDSDESDTIESYRDAYNMDSVSKIVEALDETAEVKTRKRLPCHVLFEYQTTFSVFQFTDLVSSIKNSIEFRPFNFYDMWAQKVLIKGKAGHDRVKDVYKYHYLPLNTIPGTRDRFIDYDSERSVHLIIVGMTKMGVSMAIQAAHLCHFPNFLRDSGKKTRITFIDANAAVEKDFFMGRFRELMRLSETRYVDADEKDAFKADWLVDGAKPTPENSWLDIRWEFINGRVEQPEVQDFIRRSAEDKNSIVTLAICLPKSHQAIASALYLPESVYDNCLQILTYQRLSGYIVQNISCPDEEKTEESGKGIKYRYRNMRPFGMIEYGFDTSLDNDLAAQMVSYVYPKHDFMFLVYREEEYKEGKWKEEMISNRWSSQFFANSIHVKLQSAGCSWDDDEEVIRQKLEAQIDRLKIVEHNRWNMEKLLTGFRPLAKAEEAELDGLKGEARTKRAKELKSGPNKAHWDLRSFEHVKDVDPDTFEADHDSALIRAIPKIVTRIKEITAPTPDNRA